MHFCSHNIRGRVLMPKRCYMLQRVISSAAMANPKIQSVSLHFKGAAFDPLRRRVSGASVTEGFHRLTSHLHGKAGGEIPAAQKI